MGQEADIPEKQAAKPSRTARGVYDRPLETPVRYVRGVGEARAQVLARLGIRTVADLLMHVPRRYEDRRFITPIAAVKANSMVVIAGRIQTCGVGSYRTGRSFFEALLSDGTGAIVCRWYNALYLQEHIRRGDLLVLHGKVTRVRGGLVMQHPEFEHLDQDAADHSLNMGRIVPVYSLAEGITQRVMRKIMWNCVESYAGRVAEALPERLLLRRGLPAIQQALRDVHFPEAIAAAEKARARLAFEELLYLQLVLVSRKRRVESEVQGIAHVCPGRLKDKFLKTLSFKLTAAQERVIAEIEHDLKAPYPMHRLLQGDVGSGKTVVAVCAMLQAIESGSQTALMAPTEILAEQHGRVIKGFLEPLGIRAPLLTGSVSSEERKKIADALARGRIQVVVGTHALIQQPIRFRRLGLAVIDEQHKFGVAQRAAMYRKGASPDILVMTATPIPRTLAMTVYGDLGVSGIDVTPPGRKPVRTHLVKGSELDQVYQFIVDQVRRGQQAFVVCPLVSESEKVEARAATETYERLRHKELSALRLGLLHGQMPADEKDSVMGAFRRRELDVLVATPVVEVGVDVPNASVMLILSAERFGLAQLHQLRGRVARSRHQPHCFLHAEKLTDEAKQRLKVLVRTNDGFKIAEEDLKLRGMGNLLGTQQWGQFRLRVADLLRDEQLVRAAREEAFDLLAADPKLQDPAHRLLAERVRAFAQMGGGLADVG